MINVLECSLELFFIHEKKKRARLHKKKKRGTKKPNFNNFQTTFFLWGGRGFLFQFPRTCLILAFIGSRISLVVVVVVVVGIIFMPVVAVLEPIGVLEMGQRLDLGLETEALEALDLFLQRFGV